MAKRRALSLRLMDGMKEAAKDSKPAIRANARWAKNTAIGTAKGVAVAAAATSAAEIVRQGTKKALKHR